MAASKPSPIPYARPLARVGYARALYRYFRDGDASIFGKLFVVAAIFYVVWPADLVPDVIPFLGWLDDIGAAGFATAYLARVAGRYRQPEQLAPPGAP